MERFKQLLDHLAIELGLALGSAAVLILKRLLWKKNNDKEIEMLEGKELEGQIGSIGKYEVDVDAKGELSVMVGLKIDMLAELEKLAAKSNTKLDDAVVNAIKKLMGRE